MKACCEEGSAGIPLLQGIPQGSVAHAPTIANAQQKLLLSNPRVGLDWDVFIVEYHESDSFGLTALFAIIGESGFWCRPFVRWRRRTLVENVLRNMATTARGYLY